MSILSIAQRLKDVFGYSIEPDQMPEINARGHTLDTIYYQHPYRFMTDNADSLTAKYGHWTQGIEHLETWCKENCKGKWFDDLRRLANINGELVPNEVGGSDWLIFAFELESDCVMFTLQYP